MRQPHGVGIGHGIGHDHQRTTLQSRSRGVGVGQTHHRIRAHDPQRLDLAVSDSLKKLDRFQAGPRGDGGRLPKPPHPLDILRREIHVCRQLVR